jgi:succinate dehydrogenase / fumarate reductase iron-sulfur subunit
MRHFKDGDRLIIEPWRAGAFPVISDLVVDRSAFDHIMEAGGFVSVSSGQAPEANTIPVPRPAAKNPWTRPPVLDVEPALPLAKSLCHAVRGSQGFHLGQLPQEQVERNSRVLKMVKAMDEAGFGNCTNIELL